MAKVYYEKDADLRPLQGKTVAVLGYGSQGHAQAQNLRDSGIDVVVGLYEGSRSWAKAEADGLRVATAREAAARADVVQVLLPDEVQKRVYDEAVRPNLSAGKALGFSHGFNIHFGQIVPPPDVDVFLVAPKSPGHILRRTYVSGEGVPALLAVHQGGDRAQRLALAYARAIGVARAGVFETTFREETETDLFGEQTVLCGGVTRLIQAGFETLVEAGYSPEAAYFECCHELKLIVDMINEGGLQWMRYSISDTAEYGDYTRGPRVITDETKREMKRILGEIQRGEFAKEWILENQAGRPAFKAARRNAEAHPIEEVGERLRAMMPWLEAARREKMAAKGLIAPAKKAASAPAVRRERAASRPRRVKARSR